MMKIVPAVLAATKEGLKEQVDRVEQLTDLISFDVASGDFVDGLDTPTPKDFPNLPEGKKVFWHLMVNNPSEIIDNCFEAKIIAVHAEAFSKSPELGRRTVVKIKEKGALACLVFNPTTNPQEFEDLIRQVDIVQIMTVIPGAQGRDFDGTNLEQIPYIHSVNPSIKIAIDGSINAETIKKVLPHNPYYLVVGSFLTKSENPKGNFDLLNTITQ